VQLTVFKTGDKYWLLVQRPWIVNEDHEIQRAFARMNAARARILHFQEQRRRAVRKRLRCRCLLPIVGNITVRSFRALLPLDCRYLINTEDIHLPAFIEDDDNIWASGRQKDVAWFCHFDPRATGRLKCKGAKRFLQRSF
jgi:hypothetical protein